MMNPNASYRDLVGKAELAWDLERNAMDNIAKDSGIDLDKFEPVGLSIHFGYKFFGLSIYLAERKKIDGKRRIKNVSSNMSFEKFQKLLKGFTIKVFQPQVKWDENFEYEGESSIGDL